METRELFERLIVDEPPLRLSPLAPLRPAGRRTERRRYAERRSRALVAVVVVGSGVVVAGAAWDGSHDRPCLGHPECTSISRTGTAGRPGFCLLLGGSDQRLATRAVYELLRAAYGGGLERLSPPASRCSAAPPITDKTQFVGRRWSTGPRGLGMLRVVTDTAAEANTRYAGLLSGDVCAEASRRSQRVRLNRRLRARGTARRRQPVDLSGRESTPGDISNRSSTSPWARRCSNATRSSSPRTAARWTCSSDPDERCGRTDSRR